MITKSIKQTLEVAAIMLQTEQKKVASFEYHIVQLLKKDRIQMHKNAELEKELNVLKDKIDIISGMIHCSEMFL